ncbi:MAG TPA: MjaI family restriction endonuclease, partial [Aquificae bacterium]|nr:MjaI family restriction endonuclease [Aquificota bacterium]
KKYYLANHKKQLDEATEKVWNMLQNLKESIEKIDKETIRNWVYDLVINKTAEGLIIQEFILKYLSNKFNKKYRLATPEEESKGIDGFIGDIPVQIKSKSYKMKTNVKNEKMNIFIIFYSKTNKYLIIEYDESIFQKT